jgi:hypothetical protein
MKQSTNVGRLCADSPVVFQKVKLWMPEHGHGSTPTKLTAIDDRCATLEKINFTMKGDWQLIVTTTDSDTGTFVVNIAE